MNVKRAATAGFCMGVSLALHKLENAIKQPDKKKDARICTFGPIIHNPQVLADYEKQGVVCLSSSREAEMNDIIIIRAHGIPQNEEQELRSCGAELVDATCPRVKQAQVSIAEATSKGETLLLFGDADHPEVRGLISYANGPSHVFASMDELAAMNLDPSLSWVLASQTTQDAAAFERIHKHLAMRLPHIAELRTICDATGKRQSEAMDIADQVEAMVVVGGRQSGNTRRLAALASEAGVVTYHVETIQELSKEQFRNISCVGLTAGASTPKELIDEAEEWLGAL